MCKYERSSLSKRFHCLELFYANNTASKKTPKFTKYYIITISKDVENVNKTTLPFHPACRFSLTPTTPMLPCFSRTPNWHLLPQDSSPLLVPQGKSTPLEASFPVLLQTPPFRALC